MTCPANVIPVPAYPGRALRDPFLQDHGELLRLLLIGLRIESAVHGVHVW